MPREDWRREERARTRRRDYEDRDRRDFGQADYSRDYAYDPHTRTGYRAEEDLPSRSADYGQADYTTDWGYDRQRGGFYRQEGGREREDRDRQPTHDERGASRSWMDRAGDFLAGRPRYDERGEYERERRYPEEPRSVERRAEGRGDEDRYIEDRRRRRGPSDRVLWAVVVERLEDERRLDLRDVDVTVQDGEVTLNGTVRRKEDKRRIEDIADVEGVRNVQNNLRVRERDRGWGFF